MAKKLKFGNAILCEFVSKGERGKNTLVNVYSGDVLAHSMPTKLQFGFFAEFLPDTENPITVTLSICLGRKVLAKAELKITDPEPGKPSVFVIQSLGLSVEKDLEFSVYAESEGYVKTKVLSKRIIEMKLTPTPTS